MNIWAFFSPMRIYTPKTMQSCVCVFPTSLKGVALTWYGGLPLSSIDNFDTLVKHFSSQYAANWLHCMTSVTLASLRQTNDESLQKFMDKFGCIVVQI